MSLDRMYAIVERSGDGVPARMMEERWSVDVSLEEGRRDQRSGLVAGWWFSTCGVDVASCSASIDGDDCASDDDVDDDATARRKTSSVDDDDDDAGAPLHSWPCGGDCDCGRCWGRYRLYRDSCCGCDSPTYDVVHV